MDHDSTGERHELPITREAFKEIFDKVCDDYGNTESNEEKLQYARNRIKNTLGVDIDIDDYVDEATMKEMNGASIPSNVMKVASITSIDMEISDISPMERDYLDRGARRAEERERELAAKREAEARRIKAWNAASDAAVARFRERRAAEMEARDATGVDTGALKERKVELERERKELLDRVKAIDGAILGIERELGKSSPPEGWILGDEILDLVNGSPVLSFPEMDKSDLARIRVKAGGQVESLDIVAYKYHDVDDVDKYLVGYELDFTFRFKNMEEELQEEMGHDIPAALFGKVYAREGHEGEDATESERQEYFYDFDEEYYVECTTVEHLKDVVLRACLAAIDMDREFYFDFAC